MQQPFEQTLTLRLMLLLSLFMGLAILPHGMNLSLPINLYLIALFGWRLSSLYLPKLQPGRWLLLLATFGAIFLVYSHYQTLIGRDAGVALLANMLLLKVMEVKKRRDIYVSVFISYFVVITQFLFSQSIVLALYLLLVIICLTALLLEINRVKPSSHLHEPILKTLIIGIQALPIALILFVIFPRITQPLWNFATDSSAMTGLSDRVTPGAISQLIESPGVAFRVQFKQTPPPTAQRYWRGLVLWDTDGYSWYTDRSRPMGYDAVEVIQIGDPIAYEVFLEPHNKPWLYSLDLPIAAPTNSRLSRDFQLLKNRPVTQPLHYNGRSATNYRTPQLPPVLRKRALQLNDNVTQRQRDLVSQWQAASLNDKQIVDQALRYFNTQPFVYTLTPPRYIENAIDEFLFEGREGFCEHYATSFTQLMRIAAIPARLVLGYQGGEYNTLGDYFIVRQHDAHAWSEVWLEGRGWVRIDPTAAVAPERVNYPIRLNFGEEGSPALFNIGSGGFVGSMVRQFAYAFDSANVQWERWIIGYSREHQFSLMHSLGFDTFTASQWSFITIGMIAVSLLFVGLRITWQGKQRQTRTKRIYDRFCRRLSRLGITRRPYEGPLDFARRASRRRPDLAVQIMRIIDHYIQLRYASRRTDMECQLFARQVRKFRPRRR
ncbi:MAG: DUF3488 and DUF4129 domain-containing transglutaminase family protein [Candidatus Thiodiazotropha sp. (ex. Lucinoma kazani)]